MRSIQAQAVSRMQRDLKQINGVPDVDLGLAADLKDVRSRQDGISHVERRAILGPLGDR